jgi:hypothetical protein
MERVTAGQREYHMEVFNRQKIGGVLIEPCRPRGAPTFGAMSIPAGAI